MIIIRIKQKESEAKSLKVSMKKLESQNLEDIKIEQKLESQIEEIKVI